MSLPRCARRPLALALAGLASGIVTIVTIVALVAAPTVARAEEALVAGEEVGSVGPRERSDWYLGVGQAFGILFSGARDVAPGSLTQVRVGAVVKPRVLAGAQVYAAFDIGKSTQSVLSGTLGGLFDFTLFPIRRTGFFVRGGLGAGAYWSQLRGTFARPTAIEGVSEGRQLAPGGAGMAALGHELWLGRNVNLAMLLRYDGMLIFDGPRLVNGVSVGVALIVY